MLQNGLSRHAPARLIHQQGADHGLGQRGDVLRDGVIPAANLAKQVLRVGVKERVVADQEGVEDNSEAPEVSGLPTVAAWL